MDIQQVVKQSLPASMTTLDKLGPSFTRMIRISTVICYASDLKPPRRAADAQSLNQARDNTHDEVNGGALPMQERPEALQEGAATGDAEQLPPGTPMRMALGTEI